MMRGYRSRVAPCRSSLEPSPHSPLPILSEPYLEFRRLHVPAQIAEVHAPPRAPGGHGGPVVVALSRALVAGHPPAAPAAADVAVLPARVWLDKGGKNGVCQMGSNRGLKKRLDSGLEKGLGTGGEKSQ